MKTTLGILLLAILLISCTDEQKEAVIEDKPEQIVLISINSPEPYYHYLSQDSIGAQKSEQKGPYSPVDSHKFLYFDAQNSMSSWKPKENVIDTLVIPYYKDYLELTARNIYTEIPNTYLVQNGDTVVFKYVNKIPVAEITNRQVNDEELNYSNHRLLTLFDNKYTSHHKVFVGFLLDNDQSMEQSTIQYFQQAVEDKKNELMLLDTLRKNKLISVDNYRYRVEVLNGLMARHKNNKIIKDWITDNKSFFYKENEEQVYRLDLKETDSLMTFGYFRDYLTDLSKYDLSFIQENSVESGAFYVDARVRFDSIVSDRKFNQTAKNYLLTNIYYAICRNFSVDDKKAYFKKLQEQTTDREKLNQIQKDFKLDFSKSDRLILTSLSNDSTTFADVVKGNKGKWLYVDFWASWCKPCRESMPATDKLKTALEKENIEYVYLSLNDKKDNWQQAVKADDMPQNLNYFIENGNVSQVVEDLGVRTIPHYIIYNPNGELVSGFAKRPGKGAEAELRELIAEFDSPGTSGELN